MRISETLYCCCGSIGRAERAGRARPRLGMAFVALLLLASAASAQKAEERVARRLQTAVAKAGKSTRVGVVVKNLKTGAVWYEHGGGEPLKPGSVMKLFTTAAALLKFGPDFQYETPIYRVNDELWVIGSGDPGLGDERLMHKHNRARDALLREWAAAVKATGASPAIHTIVIDDSIFDHEFRSPGWPADQNVRWYQAPVGGINYNDNCLDSAVAVEHGKVTLTLTPPLPASLIDNRLTLGRKHTAIVKRDPSSDLFIFSGMVAKAGGFESISANEPTLFFANALVEALRAGGVQLAPDISLVRDRIQPGMLTGREPLNVQRTALRDCIWRADTFSQNLFAECLLKTLGAYDAKGRRGAEPGSFAGGAKAVAEVLGRAGVDMQGSTQADGSGLSHEDRVSAAQIVKLLQVMDGEPTGRFFKECLAEPGQEGTLKRKYTEPIFKGRLRAKTGTIKGVSALAGYVSRPEGGDLVFAVLANGPAAAEIPPLVAKALVE